MAESGVERRLAAILAADVVGYSRLMAADEEGTLARLRGLRAELIDPTIATHRGRTVKLIGDGALVEFASVVDAVRCAVDIQRGMAERDPALPDDRRIRFRIGVNLGDVIIEGDDIYGDGVNIAARLEGLAEPGGIVISGTAFDHAKKAEAGFQYIGRQPVKNIPEPVRAYQVLLDPAAVGSVVEEEAPVAPSWRWPALAAAIALALLAGGGAWLWHTYWRIPTIEAASVERMTFPLPDKPSIAVLPFDNLSGNPEQEYLADGITEGIITVLSKVPNLFVIGRDSTDTYKGKQISVKHVSEELGVRYVLEGSFQRSGDRVRVTAQLIDALSGRHLWAEDYDREFSDIFDLQDSINEQIMTELEVNLTYGEEARVRRHSTDNPEAYEYFLRGLDLHRHFSKLEMEQSASLFEKAVALDPNFASAWVWLGHNYAVRARYGWLENRERSNARAIALAEKALSIDETHAEAYALLAFVYSYQKKNKEAIALLRKAVSLNPNHATNIALLARGLTLDDQAEEALRLIRKAMRLSPYYPAWYLEMLGRAHYVLEQYDEAVEALESYHTRTPGDPDGFVELAYAYAGAGRFDEARSTVAELLKQDGTYQIEKYGLEMFESPRVRERIADHLRRAGLPE